MSVLDEFLSLFTSSERSPCVLTVKAVGARLKDLLHMAKVTLSRIFEISKLLTTPAGQQLKDGLSYISELAELTLRNLRNGLTYADNFDCELKRISLKNDTETVITPSEQKKKVTEVRVRRVLDSSYYVVDSFGWKYNAAGEVVVKIIYTAFSPADSALAYPIEILIYF